MGQACQEGVIHSLRGLYEALERNKVILITRQNKVINQDNGKNDAVKRDKEKHSLSVISFSGKEKLKIRS